MALDLSSLRKSVTALERIAVRSQDEEFMNSLDELTQNAIRSGVIQHFEFTYELCWKMIQRWIRINKTPEDADHARTRKELIRLAARCGLIADPISWFAYGEARNITSLTYDEETAEAVFEAAGKIVYDATYLLAQLERLND
jgi:nucleotidyltransferase substrate binding protein (TIGR01987 family)